MISVIIPTYNNLQLFKQALASVLKQQNCEYEVIVVDDSLIDDIEKYITSINNSSIKYFHNKPSKGAIHNWNFGLSLAKGDGIILLHHDESFAEEDFFWRVNEKLRQYDVVIHGKKVFLAQKEKKDRIPAWVKSVVLKIKYPLFSLNVIGPCACFAFRKNIMEDFDTRLHWKVDTEWYFRMLKKTKQITFVNRPDIISHHGHKDQITNNINIKEVAANDILIIKSKYHSFFVNICLKIGTIINKKKYTNI